MKKTITFFCGSKDTIHSLNTSCIRDIITGLHTKYQYAYGGGTHGLMKQVYEACKDCNVHLTSVNCNRWKEDEHECQVNLYFTSIIERQNKLLDIGDIYIVAPGGVGTMFEALQAITMNDVKEACKPIYFLNVLHYFDSFFDMLEDARKLGTINKTNDELLVHKIDDIDNLIEMLKCKENV